MDGSRAGPTQTGSAESTVRPEPRRGPSAESVRHQRKRARCASPFERRRAESNRRMEVLQYSPFLRIWCNLVAPLHVEHHRTCIPWHPFAPIASALCPRLCPAGPATIASACRRPRGIRVPLSYRVTWTPRGGLESGWTRGARRSERRAANRGPSAVGQPPTRRIWRAFGTRRDTWVDARPGNAGCLIVNAHPFPHPSAQTPTNSLRAFCNTYYG